LSAARRTTARIIDGSDPAPDGVDADNTIIGKDRFRQIYPSALLLGGVLSGAASLLHVAIIFGGPDWYRFFGAGERMAQLAERGSAYPAIVTAGIALVLAVWALYGLSGAGVIGRLPLLRVALVLIALIYLARGILGIPTVMLMDDPYSKQLRARMTFMILSSAICIFVGLCYAVGAATVWRRSDAIDGGHAPLR
jgi:putative oxidoreductase